jgi:TonB family protein
MGLTRLACSVTLLAVFGCATVPPSEPASPDAVVDEGQALDEEPVPVRQVPPSYPPYAREARIEGTVVLHVLVGELGNVEAVKVIQPIAGLNEEAVKAVKQWVFKPALKDGHPVAAWLRVPLIFHIAGERRP